MSYSDKDVLVRQWLNSGSELKTQILSPLADSFFIFDSNKIPSTVAAGILSGIVYVSKSGNDGTGAVNSPHRPFLTIQAGISAASAGMCVVVHPGAYDETIVLKNLVNLLFLPGARISHTATAGGQYIISDNSVAITCGIYGDQNHTTTSSGGNSSGGLLVNTSSNIEFRGGISVSGNALAPLVNVGGTVVAVGNFSSSSQPAVYNISGTMVVRGDVTQTGSGPCVRCDAGTQRVYGNLYGGASSAGCALCTGGTQYLEGNLQVLSGGIAAECTGGEQTVRGEIDGIGTAAKVSSTGSQIIYGNCYSTTGICVDSRDGRPQKIYGDVYSSSNWGGVIIGDTKIVGDLSSGAFTGATVADGGVLEVVNGEVSAGGANAPAISFSGTASTVIGRAAVFRPHGTATHCISRTADSATHTAKIVSSAGTRPVAGANITVSVGDFLEDGDI